MICQVNFSFKNMVESKMANTMEVRSIVETVEALPSDKALKENTVASVVAIPAQIKMIQVLVSMSFKVPKFPSKVTSPQVIVNIKTDCMANARLESTVFKPALVSTITKAAEIAEIGRAHV